MALITIEDGMLTVTMQGIDKILALRGHITVPLVHILGIEVRPEEAGRWWTGFRIGTNLPGVVKAGTFLTGEGKLFFDVHDPERALGIELEHETYRKLIVEGPDDETPEVTALRIRAALRRGSI